MHRTGILRWNVKFLGVALINFKLKRTIIMRQLGLEIETIALTYLEKQDFQLLARNFQSYRAEIDLIGLMEKTLVFVEVRYRKSKNYGHPLESVTVNKQKKIIQGAQGFLKKYPRYNKLSCRFDVVAVTLKGNDYDINWIPNAFQLFNIRGRSCIF